MKEPTELSQQLRLWRTRHGLSRSQAADRLGVRFGSLKDWEQSAHQPSPLGVQALTAKMAAIDEETRKPSIGYTLHDVPTVDHRANQEQTK